VETLEKAVICKPGRVLIKNEIGRYIDLGVPILQTVRKKKTVV
jgi:hypothetical protein